MRMMQLKCNRWRTGRTISELLAFKYTKTTESNLNLMNKVRRRELHATTDKWALLSKTKPHMDQRKYFKATVKIFSLS